MGLLSWAYKEGYNHINEKKTRDYKGKSFVVWYNLRGSLSYQNIRLKVVTNANIAT